MFPSPSRLLPLLVLAGALGLTPSAHAASKSYVGVQPTQDVVVFDGAVATEVNDLTVTYSAGKVTFTDAVSAVTAGSGCQQAQPRTSVCSHKAAWQMLADGGPGNDRLIGKAGSGAHVFYGGGAGNDTIIGSADNETVSGNADNDVIRPGAGIDEIWGGAGVDTLDYSERTGPVFVDLAHDDGQGEKFEDDEIKDASIEVVVTGSGHDELRGNGSANTLTGKGGQDNYYGVGGNDVVHAREGVRDWIYCGGGTDTVYADFEDQVSGDCETVLRANPGVQQGGGGQLADPNGPTDPPPPAPQPEPGDAPQDPAGDPAAQPGEQQPPAGSGDGTPPASVPGDMTAPVLTDSAFAPARFQLRRGTALYYSLSEAATVRVTIMRLLPGRRTGRGRCVAPTARLVSTGAKKCVRARARGLLEWTSAAGPNKAGFNGRVGEQALKPGAYRAVLVAIDGSGNRSTRSRNRFRVLP